MRRHWYAFCASSSVSIEGETIEGAGASSGCAGVKAAFASLPAGFRDARKTATEHAIEQMMHKRIVAGVGNPPSNAAMIRSPNKRGKPVSK